MIRDYLFKRDWTYRTPLKTIAYPKGFKGVLPAEVLIAARKARVIAIPRSRKKA